MEKASERIEEHESAEDALGQSDLRFRRIFEHSNDAIFVIGRADHTGRVWPEAETTSRLGRRLSTAPSLPVSLRPTAYK